MKRHQLLDHLQLPGQADFLDDGARIPEPVSGRLRVRRHVRIDLVAAEVGGQRLECLSCRSGMGGNSAPIGSQRQNSREGHLGFYECC